MKGNKRKTAEISTEVVEENKQVLLLPNGRVELNYVADDVPWIGFRFHSAFIHQLVDLAKSQNSPAPVFPPVRPLQIFWIFVCHCDAVISPMLPTINLSPICRRPSKSKQNLPKKCRPNKETVDLTLPTTPSTRGRIHLLRCLQQPWQLYFRQSYQTTKPSSALLNPTRMGKRSDRKRRKLPRNQSSR